MYTEEIKNISNHILDNIIEIRREIHRNPEFGFMEFKTSALVAEHMTLLGLEIRRNIAGTGVIGLLRGDKPGKTVALRADMDALPVQEETGLEYASQNKGYMHACGHDLHTAILLGAAEILTRMKSRIAGNVKFIFQPGEEGLGGGRVMVEEGALENPQVDVILAGHVTPYLPTGHISIGTGPVMASPSDFEITVVGRGGHAAQPHTTIDPITIGLNIVNLFQTIISRERNPVKNALLSVASFNAGNCHNVIPDTAVMKGTVRTFDPETDKWISKRMEEIVSSVTKACGAGYVFKYVPSYPPVVNDAGVVKMLVEAAGVLSSVEHTITDPDPSMLAEDFSYFAGKVPGAMYHMGCRKSPDEPSYNLHNCRFNPDENCILIGMQLMSQFAASYLRNTVLRICSR